MILSAYGEEVTEDTGAEWYLPYAEKLESLGILPQHSYVAWQPLNRERAAELNCVWQTDCAGGNDILWCPSTIDTDEHGAFYPHTWPHDTAKYIVEFLKSLK